MTMMAIGSNRAMPFPRRCKSTAALVALLVSYFGPLALADTGGWMRTLIAEKEGAFAASPLVPRAWCSRGRSAGRTKPWLRLTGPRGEPVYINMEQITSIRSDAEISGAKTQLEFTSGKFQRVQEDVEQVMRLISAASEAQESGVTSSVLLICADSN